MPETTGTYKPLVLVDTENLPEDERLDYILIVTPNFVHFDPAMKAIEAGIPVMCEKPLTVDLEQADKLVEAATSKGLPFAVAHTYLGHWSSWFSRFVVTSGLLGDIRWVDSSYLQGWLAKRADKPCALVFNAVTAIGTCPGERLAVFVKLTLVVILCKRF